MTWGGLGDVVCTTPLFAAIREALPDTRLHVVALGDTDRQIVDADPAVDATSTRAEFSFDRSLQTLCFEPRVGILGIMQTESRPITAIMADLLHLPLKSRSPRLHPSLDDRRRAAALREETGPYVAVHTASRDEARNWPVSSWTALIDDLDVPAVQVGGPDDPVLPGAVDRRGTPFLTSAAILEHAQAVVAVNSSMQHAAAAFDVPAVVLFGPSPPEIFSHDGHRAVQADTCNCYRRLHEAIECDGPCVDAIPPSEVRRALASARATATAD